MRFACLWPPSAGPFTLTDCHATRTVKLFWPQIEDVEW